MGPDGLVYATGHTDFRMPTEASNVARIDPETLDFERIFQRYVLRPSGPVHSCPQESHLSL